MTKLRRLFWFALLGGAGFAVWSMIQRKNAAPAAASPEWPPIDASPAPASADDAAAPPAAMAGQHSDDARGDADPAPAASEPSERWIEPIDGACPISHPIKANDNSGIFHVPGGRFYDRTGAERCYARTEDAEADGYRAAKS
jgi:hypothetical protein